MKKEKDPAAAPVRSAGLEDPLGAAAALDEPLRRKLYFHVAETSGEVSRDEAAKAAGISRDLAGFHLDRLVAEGLLESTFRRLSGRQGPGAGRPSKLYRRSSRQLELSLPARRYEFAAQLLASSLEEAPPAARANLAAVSRRRGEQIGADARKQGSESGGEQPAAACLVAALAAHGYEPEEVPGEIRLRNCPFHALAGEHTALVCGMNLALLEGVVAGLGADDLVPVLEPRPPYCCVNFRLAPESRR